MQIKQGQIPSGPLVLPAAPAPTPAGLSLFMHTPVVAPAPAMSAATSQHALGTRPSTLAPAAALQLQRPALGPGTAAEPSLASRPAQRQASGSAAPAAAPRGALEASEMPSLAPAARHFPHPAAAVAADRIPKEAPSPPYQSVDERGSIPQQHRQAPSAGPTKAGSSPQEGAAAVAAGMAPSRAPGLSSQLSSIMQLIAQQDNQGHAPEPEATSSMSALEAPLHQRSFAVAPSAGHPACPPCTCPSPWAPAADPSATPPLGLPTKAVPPSTHPVNSVSMVRAPETHGAGLSAPGPEQPAQNQPPPSPSQLRAVPDPSFPPQAPRYVALPSHPTGTHQDIQRAPDTALLPIAATPLVPYAATAPSPLQSSEGPQHGLAAVAGSRVRPPAMSAALAAAPAGAAAAGPGGQAGQSGNATTAEPLHSRSLAPAIQEGTLDLHGNGTLVHSSSISAPSPLPEPLWIGTALPSRNSSLASLLG